MIPQPLSQEDGGLRTSESTQGLRERGRENDNILSYLVFDLTSTFHISCRNAALGPISIPTPP